MKTCFWTLLDSTDRLLEEQELTRKKEEFIAQLKRKFRLVFEFLKKGFKPSSILVVIQR